MRTIKYFRWPIGISLTTGLILGLLLGFSLDYTEFIQTVFMPIRTWLIFIGLVALIALEVLTRKVATAPPWPILILLIFSSFSLGLLLGGIP